MPSGALAAIVVAASSIDIPVTSRTSPRRRRSCDISSTSTTELSRTQVSSHNPAAALTTAIVA
jgi:hypothetical protein